MSNRHRRKKVKINPGIIVLLVLLIICVIIQFWPIVLILIAVLIVLLIIFSCLNKKKKQNYARVFGNINYDDMDGLEFEQFIANLLSLNMYTNVEVTKASGDFGIDVLAKRDGIQYGIQCKCYSSNVGNHAVHEAYAGAAYYKCDYSIVVTNSYFTKAAKKEAQELKVILWDRDTIERMLTVAYKNGKQNQGSTSYKSTDGKEYADSVIVICPMCEQKIRIGNAEGKMMFIRCPKCNYSFYERL